MRTVISAQNSAFVRRAVADTSSALALDPGASPLWIVYGSYVLNTNRPESDLDALCIYPGAPSPARIVRTFEDVPVHATIISPVTLAEDGAERLFGGYFTGKIINPHIKLSGTPGLRLAARRHAGRFIGPLAGYLGARTGRETHTAEQVTGLVFIAYLSTDPSFDAYFLSYTLAPNFDAAWDALCEETVSMLLASKQLRRAGDAFAFTQPLKTYQEFHTERMMVSARHWSFGAVCHGGDHRFQDTIFRLAREKRSRIDPTGAAYDTALRFLRTSAGIDEVFI